MCDCSHGTQWLSFQTTLQSLSTPKPFPDGIGPLQRRVLSVRSSSDGAVWTEAAGLLLPDPKLDPPELEFLSMIPFWYGNGRYKPMMAQEPSPNPHLILT